MPRSIRTPESIATGQRVRALRVGANMTQVELAAAVDVQRGTIAGIEVGAAKPGRSTLAKIAKLFEVTMDHLETGTPTIGPQLPGEAAQSAEEAALLDIWRELDEPERRAALADMRIRRARLRTRQRRDAGTSDSPPHSKTLP